MPNMQCQHEMTNMKFTNMKLKYLFLAFGAWFVALTQVSCETKIDTGWTIDDVEDDPIIEAPKVQANAPLYWTIDRKSTV